MIGHCPNCGRYFDSLGRSLEHPFGRWVRAALCDDCRSPGSLRCYSCGRLLEGYVKGVDMQRRCFECHATADANREAYAARQLFVGEIARMCGVLKLRQRELILLRARRDYGAKR